MRAESEAAVKEIRDGLLEPWDSWELHRNPSALRSVSLASGRVGVVLFLAQHAGARGDAVSESRRDLLLDQTFRLLPETTLDGSLFSGFAGVAWVCQWLSNEPPRDHDANEQIDQVLVERLQNLEMALEFDLMSGLVGMGLYFLDRIPTRAAFDGLSLILQRLERTAHREPEGVWWKARRDGAAAPGNLGVSHGVAGVIGFLGRLISAKLFRERAEPLLVDAVRWLVSHRQEVFEGFGFPHHTFPINRCRLSWCYGDVGVAAVLEAVGLVLRRDDWRQVALETGHLAAARGLENSGVVDAGLCHGSAGLGHAFHRLYHSTGEEAFREASIRWFRHCLGQRDPQDSRCGFQAWSHELVRDGSFVADPCWLTGSAGVGLGLLAALESQPPCWDRPLLLD